MSCDCCVPLASGSCQNESHALGGRQRGSVLLPALLMVPGTSHVPDWPQVGDLAYVYRVQEGEGSLGGYRAQWAQLAAGEGGRKSGISCSAAQLRQVVEYKGLRRVVSEYASGFGAWRGEGTLPGPWQAKGQGSLPQGLSAARPPPPVPSSCGLSLCRQKGADPLLSVSSQGPVLGSFGGELASEELRQGLL